jgi:anhydro-N-acetylmuramic acid kinase
VVVNIGGIANLTDLAPGRPTTGFDCGPGNMLMDAWIRDHQDAAYDHDGAWARQGQVLPDLHAALCRYEFFSRKPPKSCGREEFNLDWLKGHLNGGEAAMDVQRTLLELTAVTISRAIELATDERGTEILLCGGGAHNGLLMERLVALLPECGVKKTDERGLSADWLEAIAFAWLARQCVLGKPSNLPQVTGARGPRALGAIYPA